MKNLKSGDFVKITGTVETPNWVFVPCITIADDVSDRDKNGNISQQVLDWHRKMVTQSISLKKDEYVIGIYIDKGIFFINNKKMCMSCPETMIFERLA